MDEIIVERTPDGPKITRAPLHAAITWEFLAGTMGRAAAHVDIANGIITLAGVVDYKIIGAEERFAVVERVADRR
jgi:hypothetical protein